MLNSGNPPGQRNAPSLRSCSIQDAAQPGSPLETIGLIDSTLLIMLIGREDRTDYVSNVDASPLSKGPSRVGRGGRLCFEADGTVQDVALVALNEHGCLRLFYSRGQCPVQKKERTEACCG